MTTTLDQSMPALRAPRMLLATDFDGTIAPIVDQPERAAALPAALEALGRLTLVEGTVVAIVSGRSLVDLEARTPLEGVLRVGSHGAELSGLPFALTESQLGLLGSIRDRVQAACLSCPGSEMELKPTGVAFHYRRSDPEIAAELVKALSRELESISEAHLRPGKRVLEISVVQADKGTALMELRRRAEVSSVIYLGDDQTDEEAFAVLGASDLGIKVGDGPSIAQARLCGPEAVAEYLTEVLQLREGAEVSAS